MNAKKDFQAMKKRDRLVARFMQNEEAIGELEAVMEVLIRHHNSTLKSLMLRRDIHFNDAKKIAVLVKKIDSSQSPPSVPS